MAKQLKDILKQAHDTIKGVRNSTTEPLSIGKDPGVDYKPKAGDEADFVAKHSVQKWDEPYGNPNYADKVGYVLTKPEEKRHGNTEAKAKATNEEVEQVDEVLDSPIKKLAYVMKAKKSIEKSDPKKVKQANDVANRVIGIKRVMKKLTKEEVEALDELSTDTYHRAAHKAAKMAMSDVQGRSGPIFKKRAAQANKFRDKGMAQEKKEKAAKAVKEEAIDEVLTKSTTAGETISDFVHSDNPKFKGKSKEKRKQMALAAYYAKHPEKSNVKEDLAVPLLQGDQPPRGNSDEAIEMVKSELKALANKAMHLVMQMPDGMHVEPWCQAKIAQAKSMVSDVHDYMIYGDHKEEDEQTDTAMSFPSMNVDAARI